MGVRYFYCQVTLALALSPSSMILGATEDTPSSEHVAALRPLVTRTCRLTEHISCSQVSMNDATTLKVTHALHNTCTVTTVDLDHDTIVTYIHLLEQKDHFGHLQCYAS